MTETEPQRRPEAPQGGAKPQLRGLFFVLFLEILGASLTIPVFYYFCMHELGLSASQVGTAMACFNAAQFVGAPVFGRMSDAWGRRLILLGIFFWASLCFAATCFVQSFEELLVVRTLAGLSGGSIVVSTAMIMDASTPVERPLQLGLMGGILGVAFTIGPGLVTLALYLHEVDRRWIFATASALALTGASVGCFILEETLIPDMRTPLCEARGAKSGPLEKFTEELGEIYSHGLGCIWMGRFWASLSFLCMFATYAFLIHDAFGWGDREFGIILAMSGIGEAVIEYFLYPWLSQTLGKHSVFAAGLVLVAASLVLLPLGALSVRSVAVHVVGLALFVAGSGLSDPGMPDLVGLYAPEDRMGFAQGLTGVFRSMASVTAPLVAGRAYDSSPWLAYTIAAAAALLSAGSVGLAAFVDGGHRAGHKAVLQPLLSKPAGLPRDAAPSGPARGAQTA